MSRKLLWSVQQLDDAIGDDTLIVVDCRFALDQPDAGYRAWLESHIPGARYAHLDNDLSGPLTSSSGRHPLPSASAFSAFLARLGWEPGKTLVVYDNMSGAMAGRLWWLMRYFGHDCAAMLDGGFPAWQDAGYRLESGKLIVKGARPVKLHEHPELLMTASQVSEGLKQGSIVLVDARAPERFAGEVEPLDRIAGHIPGAVNYPFQLNLDSRGLFKTARELRDGLSVLTAESGFPNLVHMCGSGVTACHNLFAAELAGIGGGKLYAGSWSEWIQDPSRPVAP